MSEILETSKLSSIDIKILTFLSGKNSSSLSTIFTYMRALFKEITMPEIKEIIKKLKKDKLLIATYGMDISHLISITSNGEIYLENSNANISA